MCGLCTSSVLQSLYLPNIWTIVLQLLVALFCAKYIEDRAGWQHQVVKTVVKNLQRGTLDWGWCVCVLCAVFVCGVCACVCVCPVV